MTSPSERPKQEDRLDDPSPSIAEKLLAIGRECAQRLGPEFCALDHDVLLYDEEGLPR